jgi:hypothetical protein
LGGGDGRGQWEVNGREEHAQRKNGSGDVPRKSYWVPAIGVVGGLRYPALIERTSISSMATSLEDLKIGREG